jgi:hypothetical protein
MTKRYDLKNIRTLLIEGFTEEELRTLCFDEPAFNPLYDRLPQAAGKFEIARHMVDYAEQKFLLDNLLGSVKERNPARYEKHQPYYYEVAGISPVPPIQPPPLPPPSPPPVRSVPVRFDANYIWVGIGAGGATLLLLAGLGWFFISSWNKPDLATPTRAVVMPKDTPSPVPTLTITPIPSPVKTEPYFSEITFAQAYEKYKPPIGPATCFIEGIAKVHAIFDYSGMSRGALFERIWYFEGEVVARTSEVWEEVSEGTLDVFPDTQGQPLPAGNWRLELKINDKLLQQGSFTVAKQCREN